MTHGRAQEAQRVIEGIEHHFEKLSPAHDLPRVRLRPRKYTPLREVAQTLFKRHRQRTYVGLALMVAQAFFYKRSFSPTHSSSQTFTAFVRSMSVITCCRLRRATS
jgi:hypothetical protein